MALGQFVFTPTLLGFNEIKRQRQWNFASNAVAQGRDAKQFVGVGEDHVTLDGNIFEEHGVGKRQSIDDLAAMADTGQGFTLVDGSGYLYGVYVIENIDETKKYIIDNGVPRMIDFTLKLSRVDDNRIANQDQNNA